MSEFEYSFLVLGYLQRGAA